MRLRAALVAVVFAGCSAPEGTPDEPDDGVPIVELDMASAEDATPAEDAAQTVDTAATDEGTACDGECATLDFTATVGGNSATFDQAIYGLTAPEQAASGEWEVHVEVHAGGVDGCPEMSSPSPDQTVIITNIPVPETAVAFTEAEGLVVSMLDFAGDVTDQLPLTADGESLRWVAWQVCTDCAGDDPMGFLAFDVTAPVPDGSIEGHVYATHCASLDAR